MLYTNESFGRFVVGMEPKDSNRLLRHLASQAQNPEYQCFFKYETGSLAFWDNRACMHRASSDSFPQERQMRRVTVQGSVPYYDPAQAKGSEPGARL